MGGAGWFFSFLACQALEGNEVGINAEAFAFAIAQSTSAAFNEETKTLLACKDLAE